MVIPILLATFLTPSQAATGWASGSGEFLDLSFTCPVQTTCPQVCSPTADDCPEDLKCKGINETLCADGSCALFCDPALTSPCVETSRCAPVTCATIVTYYDACKQDYGPWYEFAAECHGFDNGQDDDQYAEESGKGQLTWTNPGYVFVYCWVVILTVAIVHWCWYK
jgi:hypothetical protein